MKNRLFFLPLTLFFVATNMLAINHTINNKYRQYIDLSGTWKLALGNDSIFNDIIQLPGTTDTNRKGTLNTNKSETTHLTRLYPYVGRAWYQRIVEIPASWKDKQIYLHLERTKPSCVYVDGISIFSLKEISTPQSYHLDGYLTPGKHTLTIEVDNSVQMPADRSYNQLPQQLFTSSHAFTEDTQTNWNGIIGDISLEAIDTINVCGIHISPVIKEKKIQLQLYINGWLNPQAKIQVRAIPLGWNGKISYLDLTGKDFDNTGEEFYEKKVDMYIQDMKLWSEFEPNLYSLEVEIDGKDLTSTTFGMREFTADEHHFYINGQKTFLRGKHDACVFPLTAHVPMDVDSWKKYLGTCKEYGINHLRFHSWCPPEAAFVAADELGVYLQPELPFWGDFKAEDPLLMRCLLQEGRNIFNTYGNHPSFVMFALGNELWGSIDKMKDFVDVFRKENPSKLFTFGSNYYLGYQGIKDGMDYFTTCRIGGEAWGSCNTHTRGSFSFADAADGGLINHTYPNTKMNFDEACDKATVPVISHETGQFQHIPDFNHEIPKYTGALYPYNMEIFRSRLQKAGMLHQLKDFNRATGKWAANLYKADIEMDLRTRNMAGFQLLDLQDYPGQGSAYVGILDAFMENKGFISPSEWRAFCSPVVTMFNMEKYCFTEGEPLKWDVLIANYGNHSLAGKEVHYNITYQQNGENKSNSGSLMINRDEKGLMNAGSITIPSPTFNTIQGENPHPIQAKVSVGITGETNDNSYPIWIYPAHYPQVKLNKKVIVTQEMTDEIAKKLQKGARVLWTPTNDSTFNTIDPLFQTDYWNYRMFKTICENNKKTVSPGTMGILCEPKHPVFNFYPTEEHTNWQWFPILKNSRPLVLDNLPKSYFPIIQVIDNIERNHKLGILMEWKVGKGSLIICMTDLNKCSEYPEGKAFRHSLMNYLTSDDFNPQTQVSLKELLETLREKITEKEIDELNNISPY